MYSKIPLGHLPIANLFSNNKKIKITRIIEKHIVIGELIL